jgi:undecaprenyl diphosphate synthase
LTHPAPKAVGPSGSTGALPRHVAIIMDGNGRWAKARLMPRVVGHQRGADAVKRAVTAAGELGLEVLTLYAFSSENWRRPADEVSDLMGLLRRYLLSEVQELHANNVRLRFIGDLSRLSADLLDLIAHGVNTTAANTGLTLVIALNYGSQAELTRAARLIAEQVAAGRLRPEDVSEDLLAAHLHTADLPDPDVILRTSGEQRLSNFLLWQAAYAELVFLECHWPEFQRSHLEQAIAEFQKRERRYGGR